MPPRARSWRPKPREPRVGTVMWGAAKDRHSWELGAAARRRRRRRPPPASPARAGVRDEPVWPPSVVLGGHVEPTAPRKPGVGLRVGGTGPARPMCSEGTSRPSGGTRVTSRHHLPGPEARWPVVRAGTDPTALVCGRALRGALGAAASGDTRFLWCRRARGPGPGDGGTGAAGATGQHSLTRRTPHKTSPRAENERELQ